MAIDPDKIEQYRLYLEKLFKQPVSGRRIISIEVNPLYHGQNRRTIEIGKSYTELEPGAGSETVIAIFESKSFLVVTENRGAGSGMPFIFTRDTVIRVTTDSDIT